MTPNNGVFDLVWAQCWQISLVIGLVMLAVRVFAKNRPHLAHLLWLLVLIKCVTPPVLTSPTGMFCWLRPQLVHSNDTTRVVEGMTVEIGSVRAVSAAELRVPEDASELASRGVVIGHVASNHVWRGVARVALWVWAIGFVAAAIVAILRWRSCVGRIARAAAVEHDELNQLVKQMGHQLGLRYSVSLVVTTSQLGPAVIGLLRPVLILPESLVNQKSVDSLRPIVAHELLHIRRGDLWVGVLSLVVRAVWWFHPLVWWVGRYISREAERSCDEEVLAELGCDPVVYANSLLDVLQLKNSLRAVPAFPGLKPVEVTTQRLERIMKLRQGSRKRTPWSYWLIAVVIAMLILPGGAFVAAKGKRKRPRPKPPTPLIQKAQTPSLTGNGSKKKASTEAKLLKTYRVVDLVQKLKTQAKTSEEEARQRLVAWLSPVSSEMSKRKVAWNKNDLVVQLTEQEHKDLATRIERIRKFGFVQITLSTRLLYGKMELDQLRKASPRITQADARLPANALDTRRGAVILNDDELFIHLSNFLDKPKNNLLSFPKVTVFDAQSATISDAIERPFIVGLRKLDNGSLEPDLHVVQSGIELHLKAEVSEDNAVQVRFSIRHSQIISVEKRRSQGPNGRPLELEIPKVSSNAIDGTVIVPNAKSVVISGIARDSGNESQPMTIVFTPRIYDPFTEEAISHRDVDSELFRAGKFGNRQLRLESEDSRSDVGESPTQAAIEKALEYLQRFTTASDEGDASAELETKQSSVPSRISSKSEDREPELRFADVMDVFRVSRQLSKQQFASLKNIRLEKEKIADYVDPPKQYSSGLGQIHHQHFECHVIYESEGVGKRDILYLDHRCLWLLSEDGANQKVVRRERLPLIMSKDPTYQTLPSPYYLEDDVQYFAPGPEFRLSREANASKQNAQEGH